MITDDLAVREAFHVLLLLELSHRLGDGAFVLKGGVNLRLYFASVRYSEDMDIDGDPSKRQKLTRVIPEVLRSDDFVRRLRELGIRRIEYRGRPHKDGDLTLRYKLQILTRGEVALSTKIEVSFRDRSHEDEWAMEAADERVVRPYLRLSDANLCAPHYRRTAAVRQKIVALGLRRTEQARDVFDLYVLTRGQMEDVDLQQVRRGVTDEVLNEARQRAFAIGYRQFADQVLAFLDDADRDAYESESAWDEIRLLVVELIEAAKNELRDGETT